MRVHVCLHIIDHTLLVSLQHWQECCASGTWQARGALYNESAASVCLGYNGTYGLCSNSAAPAEIPDTPTHKHTVISLCLTEPSKPVWSHKYTPVPEVLLCPGETEIWQLW